MHEDTQSQKRVKTGSPAPSCYLTTRAREGGEAIAINNHNRAKRAVLASRGVVPTDPNPPTPSVALQAGDSQHRKHAIIYQYKYVYQSPSFVVLNSLNMIEPCVEMQTD